MNEIKMAPETELLTPEYVSPELNTAKVQIVRRMNVSGGRVYYGMYNGELVANFGLTTLLGKVLKEDSTAGIDTWKGKHGVLAPFELNWSASYGTYMHVSIAKLLQTGIFNFDYEEYLTFRSYCQIEGMPMDRFDMYWECLNNDIKAFHQFMIDKHVKCLAIEYTLVHPDLLFGTPLDAVLELDFNKSRVIANVNFKSGRSGFFETHKWQANMEMVLWNSFFGGSPYEITHTFNWAPCDWEGETPTYKLKNQTGKVSIEAIKSLIALGRATGKGVFNVDKPYRSKLGGYVAVGEEQQYPKSTYREFMMKQINP